MKKTQIFLLILLFPAWLFAQERVLSGKVTESTGEGLPGASVTVKGTTIGAITDVNGDYRLVVPDGKASSLVFSFIGYVTREIEIGSNNTISVTLASSNIGLEEVIAVGYSTQKKATITGSVASIRMAQVNLLGLNLN
jgi:hypothetical protein